MKTPSRILVADDEPAIRQTLIGILQEEGFVARAVEGAEACLKATENETWDAVLLDIWLPDGDGLEVLEKIRARSDPPDVIIISGHGTIETAVRATKSGAFDFLEKPLSLEKTLLTLRHALEQRRLLRENRELRRQTAGRTELVGASVPLRALRQQIALMAPTNGRVLIYGESGVGKELVARALHRQSERRDGPFVVVNCAAIPEDGIERELFGLGRESGTPQPGRLQYADGGTLFLDEVGDMSLKTQSKVLRALDEGRFFPLGSEVSLQMDARIIAATNKNLDDEISAGRFREDLFYRLNVIPFYVPPLRERREDVSALAAYFTAEFSAAYGRPAPRWTAAALQVLSDYAWPGNVRELRNIVERVLILHPQAQSLEPRHLPAGLQRKRMERGQFDFASLPEARAAYEREYILRKLDENQGNVSRTADALGIERSHLHRKLKSLGIAQH